MGERKFFTPDLSNNPLTLYEDLKIITGGAKRSGIVKRVVGYTIKKYEKGQKNEEEGAKP